MQRRDVLKGVTGLAVGSAILAAQATAETQEKMPEVPLRSNGMKEERKGDMLYRILGKTGQQVSAIGLGGYHIGTLPSEKESVQLIRSAVDSGITFLDNCWDYHDGKSEVWMGQALRDGYRAKIFLMTKLDGRTKQAAARQIDESLQRLQTDHIDLVQIHEIIRLEDPDVCFAEGGCVEALEEAKKAGKIRFIGFTGHKDPLVHNRMLDTAAKHNYHFDTAQMPLNVLDGNFRSFARNVVPRLVEAGIGVLGMKPIASGAIAQNKIATAQECLAYALSLPTSVVITGMDSRDVLKQNLDVIKNFKPLGRSEVAALLARTAQAAEAGKYEKFKTASMFDGTAHNPQWLG